jgi:hypothetical protein
LPAIVSKLCFSRFSLQVLFVVDALIIQYLAKNIARNIGIYEVLYLRLLRIARVYFFLSKISFLCGLEFCTLSYFSEQFFSFITELPTIKKWVGTFIVPISHCI